MSNIKKRGSLWRSEIADIKRGCNGTELRRATQKEYGVESEGRRKRDGVDKRGVAAGARYVSKTARTAA